MALTREEKEGLLKDLKETKEKIGAIEEKLQRDYEDTESSPAAPPEGEAAPEEKSAETPPAE